jgi:excinuclease ABC subunit A
MTRLTQIDVRGCRVHNLRGIDVTIPHDKITVVTGVSGSGKSSLAFDTVFAEGRRRYLESLSAYARQFVEQIPRPDVDVVLGLPPTVCIDQRTTRAGSRSTVASMAEVLDALRLLWARLGTRHCERCDTPVEGTSVERIVDEILCQDNSSNPARERSSAPSSGSQDWKNCPGTVFLLAPLVARRKGFHKDVFARMIGLGVKRARVDGVALDVEPVPELSRYHEHSIEALIATAPTAFAQRDQLERAVRETLSRGGGALHVALSDDLRQTQLFSSVAACPRCGIGYGPLEPGDLSWSRKASRCPTCEGRGTQEGDDADGGEDRPCKACDGARLSRAARAIRFRGQGLHDFLAQSVAAARKLLTSYEPADARELAVLVPLREEIVTRLAFLEEVGLDYPQLGRGARTLSGGEAQRVRLASQLGTGLRGVCYVLDEPTIGLHPADNARLLRTLRALCDRGATLLVVEHDEDTIRAADHVIDLGPGAGRHGGQVVAEGTPQEIEAAPQSVTGPWLRNTVPGQFFQSSRTGQALDEATNARL